MVGSRAGTAQAGPAVSHQEVRMDGIRALFALPDSYKTAVDVVVSAGFERRRILCHC